MTEEQPTLAVSAEALVTRVLGLRHDGWRLVQIGVTKIGDTIELNYSFDRALQFQNLRLTAPAADLRVPSISGVYWCAFLYENEIHDLYGIGFDGLAVDYKGSFYRTAQKFPFATSPAPVVAPAKPAPAAPPAPPPAATT